MRNYRTPDQAVADYQRHAARLDRQGMPNCAGDYRVLQAEAQKIAVHLDAAMSRQQGEK